MLHRVRFVAEISAFLLLVLAAGFAVSEVASDGAAGLVWLVGLVAIISGIVVGTKRRSQYERSDGLTPAQRREVRKVLRSSGPVQDSNVRQAAVRRMIWRQRSTEEAIPAMWVFAGLGPVAVLVGVLISRGWYVVGGLCLVFVGVDLILDRRRTSRRLSELNVSAD